MGEHEGRFTRDPLPVFSVGGPCEQSWHGHGCLLFDVVHQAFPVPTAKSPTRHCAPEDDLDLSKQAVVAYDMSGACSFRLLTVARSGFCESTRKLILLRTVIGLVLHQIGETEKFPRALDFESLHPLLRVSKQGPCSQP